MAKKRTEVLHRISPGEKDMCVLGMSFHAITAHLGDKTCSCKALQTADHPQKNISHVKA